MREYDVINILSLDDIKNAVSFLVEDEYKMINKVVLFGSYARGDAKSNSDIDIMVEESPKFNGFAFFGFRAELMDLLKKDIDLFSIDIVDKKSEFYKKYKKDGVVYVKD